MQKAKHVVARVLPRPVLARLRGIRQRRLIQRFRPYVVSHSYGGHVFSIAIQDPLAQSWYDHDWAPLAEIAFLRTAKLREGATVFDLGAHQGVVALMLASAVGKTGRVVAVEATRHNADVAQRNTSANGAHNVVVLHAAAAAAEGTIPFAAGLNGHVATKSHAFTTVELPAVTVDSLARVYGRPDVIFVDVEGFEREVLLGAEATFDSRPDWFVEVHAQVGLEEQGGSVDGVLDEFERRNYRLFVGDIGGGRFEPLRRPAPTRHFFLIALS